MANAKYPACKLCGAHHSTRELHEWPETKPTRAQKETEPKETIPNVPLVIEETIPTRAIGIVSGKGGARIGSGRPRIHHQDRPSTATERVRAYRLRKKAAT